MPDTLTDEAMSTAPAVGNPVIRQWAGSGIRKRQIAATLARELASLPPHTRVESSMKIAARFGTSNSTAVHARFLLIAQNIIYKSGRHYFVAEPTASR
jgi:DNA-binding GntR family transcriptional regulator